MSQNNQDIINQRLSRKAKIVFVGDGAVGKTSLLSCFVNDTFPDDYLPTVFDNFSTDVAYQTHSNSEPVPVSLDIYDTAGQSDFIRFRKLTYPDTDVFAICFDVSDPVSFTNVHEAWVPELNLYNPGTKMVLVGNKIDRVDDRIVTVEEARAKANKIGACGYVECSAKTQHGLKEVFDYIVNIYVDDGYKLPYQVSNPTDTKPNVSGEGGSTGCCIIQ